MNLIASLLIITALSIPTPTLVLKTGKHIAVDGPVRLESGIVLFRSGGSYYSVPADEVDLDATRGPGSSVTVTAAEEKNKLRVTSSQRERLLRDLEQNHTGTPAPKEQTTIPDAPRRAESDSAPKGDEWQWKNSARAYEEEVRRAREQLELLARRREELRLQISGFLSQGYKPGQFSYQTTVLASVEEQIPQAELEVQRAERSHRQFLDDARRQGVMPGWLR